MMRFIVVSTFHRLADEHGCQIGKDERLNKRNQYLYEINENGERQRNRSETDSGKHLLIAPKIKISIMKQVMMM